MIARALASLFGSVWKLREKCQEGQPAWLAKIARTVYQLYQYENNSSIAWNARIAGEPCFPHGMKSIFVSGGARIGVNAVIFQQVTIGSNTLSDAKRVGSPQIGDNCYIGAGAKIIGGIRIGNNVRIGANAVVYRDVPDNAVVVSGEQITMVREKPMDNRFYTYHGRYVYYDQGRWFPVTDKVVLANLTGGPVPLDPDLERTG